MLHRIKRTKESCAVSNMRFFILFVVFLVIKFGESIPLFKDGLADRLEGGMISMGEGRIVGGNYVPITSVPWTCSQQRLGAHRCGCAIISPTVTLTAAHCAYQIPGNGFYIRAGSDSKSRDGQLVPTRDVVIHPIFNETNFGSDICIMFLVAPLNTAVPEISVIAMAAAASNVPSGTLASVSGWGPLYENGTGTEILRTVTHPVFSLFECGQRLGDMTHDMMCAGYDAGGAAACDPGSPLVSDGVLVGIMSWSRGCGRPLLPSVYSRLSTSRSWIEFVLANSRRSN